MKSCKGCKHYKKDERTRLIICEFDLHESYCEKDKEDFAIEELEKIKAKIESIRDVEVTDGTVYVSSDDVYEILDEGIAELKGENK